MPLSLFCQSHGLHASGYPLQSGYSASIRPGLPVRSAPFMPFVAHIGPQVIELRLTDPVVFQQRFFDLCRLSGGGTQPVEKGVFLDPFGARNAANADPFGQQRQCFQNRLTRCLASIEYRAVRFRKRLSAVLTPITLRAILGFSETHDLCGFDIAVQLTRFVWAKLPHLSQCVRYVSLEHHAFLALFYQQHSSGRLPEIKGRAIVLAPRVAPPKGFEPPTLGLEDPCSVR